ncbi:uncharacterized protein METZ01_LOCUS477580, partial [marine metagenome]
WSIIITELFFHSIVFRVINIQNEKGLYYFAILGWK